MSIFTTLFFLGVVDAIEGNMAVTEINAVHWRRVEVDIPLQFFPCEIREGDVFYGTRDADVTEIRCGEPPE